MTDSSARIAIFVDGANLNATARALGFDVDYKRLLREFGDRGTVIRGARAPPTPRGRR